MEKEENGTKVGICFHCEKAVEKIVQNLLNKERAEIKEMIEEIQKRFIPIGSEGYEKQELYEALEEILKKLNK